MNRRAFLRGTVSVMAMAAVLKYAAPKVKEPGLYDSINIQFIDGYEVGDWVSVSGLSNQSNNGLYRVTAVAADGMTLE